MNGDLPAARAGRGQRQLKPEPPGAAHPPGVDPDWPAAKVETERRAGLPQAGQGRAGSDLFRSLSKVALQSGQ